MNRQVYELYRNLTAVKQAELKSRYKDSPMALRFIAFLEQSPAIFKTADAVTYIYANDSEKYTVLENRFFKLRKKICDDLQDNTGDSMQHELPEEEALLNSFKQLIARGDKKAAYKLLTGLEKICWERNIFELLPSVLDNMIYCNQGFNEHDKNKELYVRLENAIELQYDLNRALMYIRQLYEVFFSKGSAHAMPLLMALKELGDKHKEYPRFIMFYHFVSLTNKLSSMDYAHNMQVISRHLSTFKKLYQDNPLVPVVIYRTNYNKIFHFHYNQVTSFYYTNQGEFEEAYLTVKEMWNMANSNDPLFRTYRTDPLFFNMFTICCVTGRYKDAFDSCNAYTAFVKETNRLDKLPMINVMRAIIYTIAYPQSFKMDAGYLIQQADEYIRSLKKGDKVQLPLGQAMLVKAEIWMLNEDIKKADKIIGDKSVLQYIQSIHADDLFNELLYALKSKEKLQVLVKKINRRKHKAIVIDEFITFKWLSDFAERKLKEI